MVKVLVNGQVMEGKVLTDKDYLIKVFNLTTLRKNGFSFTPDGELVGHNVKMSGKWLNIIDDIIRVVAETDDEIVVKVFDNYDVIPKSVRGKMYKVIK